MDVILRNVKVGQKILDIAIEGEKIAKVGKDLPHQGIKEIDGKGCLAIPGFVDCHLHLDKSLLNEKSPYQDLTGPEKGALTRERKAAFTVEEIQERAERVLLQGIRAGNLYIRTNVDVDPIVGLKGIEALLALKEKYKDMVGIQVTAFAQEGIAKYPETKELLEEAVKMGADLVGGHTIVDGKDAKEHIDFILSLACNYGVEVDFHLDESGNADHYLLPYVAEQMMILGLEGKVNGIHCCTLSTIEEEERKSAIRLMKQAGMKVTIAPTAISTRSLAPVKALLDAGIRVGLGSDNVRDFFNPLGSGDIKQIGLLLAYVHRFFTEEEILRLWDMITVDGAKLLGCQNYDIEEGKEANITLLAEKSPKEVLAKGAPVICLIRKGVDYTDKYLSSSL